MPVRPVLRPVTSGILTNITGIRGLYDPLVFHAITPSDSYEMLGVKTGTGDLTEARTSQNFAPDHESIWRAFGSGEPVYEGGRVVENLFTYSNDFTNGAWVAEAGAVKEGVASGIGPNGEDAMEVSFTSAASGIYQTVGGSGNDRTLSVWCRAVSGTTTVRLAIGGTSTSDITVTESWQRLSQSITSGGVNDRVIRCNSTNNSGNVYICCAQTETVNGQANQNPSEYVPTTTSAAKKVFANQNGNTVASNVVTEAVGTPLASVPWLRGEPAHTNSLPYSKPDTTNWSLTEGSAGDLVTNGGFDTDTDWTKGTGWSIAAGVASKTAGTSSTLNQVISWGGAGTVYKCQFTISNYSAGSVRIQSNNYVSSFFNSNGTKTAYLTMATGGQNNVYLNATADFAGDIDNVIVQPAVIESYTTGLTGAADTAVVLTDDDSGAQEYIYEDVSIPNDSNTHVLRVWIKQDAITSRFPLIGLQFRNGTGQSGFYTLNTSTGAVNTDASVGTTSVDVRDAGDWWEVLVSVANNLTGNTAARIFLYPARETTLGGGASNAATGSITIADPVELHLNTTIAAVRGSSPIFTNSAPVSTVASSMSFSDQNHDDTQGGYYCETNRFTPTPNSGIGYEVILGTSSSYVGAQLYYYDQAPYDRVMSGDGANTVSYPAVAGIGWGADTMTKFACAYGSGLRVNQNGNWGTEGSYDGAFVSSGSGKIYIYKANYQSQPALIRNIKRWNADYTTSQSLIDTEMSA